MLSPRRPHPTRRLCGVADIKLHGAPRCPGCKRSKRFLGEHCVAFAFDVDADPEAPRTIEQIQGGGRTIPSGGVDLRTSERPPDWMPSRYVRFYAGLISPGLHFSGGDEVDWRLTAGEGSWATVAADAEGGDYVVSQAGPRRLRDEYEAAAQEWTSLGRPRWDRFGVTVLSGDEQFVWLDSPDSDHRWDL